MEPSLYLYVADYPVDKGYGCLAPPSHTASIGESQMAKKTIRSQKQCPKCKDLDQRPQDRDAPSAAHKFHTEAKSSRRP